MPPRTAAPRTPFLLLTAVVPVLLTGCGSSAASGGEVVVTVTPSPSTSTAPAPATSHPPVSASPSVTAAPSTLHAPLTSPPPTKEKPPSCGPDSVKAAAAKAASTLPVDADMQDPWTTSNMDEQGYDACSPLSWIVLGTGGASRFAPRTVALFHYGKLMRSAGPTDPLPEVKRLDDRSIQVTWRSPRDSSETNYEDFSLVATSVYSWDEDAGTITRTGSLPSTASSSTTTGSGRHPAPSGAKPASSFGDSSRSVAIIRTPTGNIACDLKDDSAGCGIKSLQKSSPYPKDELGGAWFLRFSSDGSTTIGGIIEAPYYSIPGNQPETLAYGTSVYYGTWACTSESKGLTCWNVQTGHGAFMDRDGYKAF